MPRGGHEGGVVLPNGGGSEQRERLPSFSSPLFSSFNSHLRRSKLPPPPLLVFQPSLLFSKTLLPLLLFSSPLPFSKTLPPLLQLRQRGAGQQHAHGLNIR